MPHQAASIIETTRVPLVPIAKGLGDQLFKMQDWLLANKFFAAVIKPMLPEHPNVDDFKMQRQCFSNWCWAAVAQSIGRLSGVEREQCEIANVVLDDPENDKDEAKKSPHHCCGPLCFVPGLKFDIPAKLSVALKKVGCELSKDEIINNEYEPHPEKPDISAVKEHIRAKNAPVGVRIRLAPKLFHFVVISGFDSKDSVIIKDPACDPKDFITIDFEDFPEHYRTPGTWITTYFTRRQAQ